MQDIINNFPNKDDVLDFVNKIFYICESSQCSLLQCCSQCKMFLRKSKNNCAQLNFFCFIFSRKLKYTKIKFFTQIY